jgi:hypothetical protein
MNSVIQAKCIQKFRDKQNRIYGYRLVDLNGHTQDVKPENLKAAIKNGEINVVNLTLTSDGRLMDTSEKQLQSKKLGEAPKKESSSEITPLAKAFTLIDISMVDMSDHYEDFVSCTCDAAGLNNIDIWSIGDQARLRDLDSKAFQILINKHDTYLDGFMSNILDDNYEYYEIVKNEMYMENVSSVNQSKTYKAVYLIYKYFCDANKKIAKDIKTKMLADMKQNGVASTRVGYAIGHLYYKYISKDIFGTISNDYFTVGHALTNEEKQEFKELKPYTYMIRKSFNVLSPKPQVGPTFLFRNGQSGKVIVDVKMFRYGYMGESSIGIVGYIKDCGTFELDSTKSNDENAQILAKYCDKVALSIKDFAEKHESLMHILELGTQAERF